MKCHNFLVNQLQMIKFSNINWEKEIFLKVFVPIVLLASETS